MKSILLKNCCISGYEKDETSTYEILIEEKRIKKIDRTIDNADKGVTVFDLNGSYVMAMPDKFKFKDAVKSITANASDIFECKSQIGKLKEGSDADIAVFDKNPLDSDAKILMIIINGCIAYSSKNRIKYNLNTDKFEIR